ncbi:peptidoglycan-binding domain-containing protein [Streptomyces sp. S.PB5]|uniref:peptidoglycan-binding domain-containing protein n=1 Tax=Streptomyces sp. S.PB5 TaxID=3020844 RepID=UPI0025AEE8B1|nr:peptidoglycan-binding domain-containing protein [Streptomyces sp. S.PB5]MDN3027910.1 peptidoglycan-binding domain-containing protein [Streptomyces sp. S.PB5]
MSEPTGPACPECGTARPADGGLACSCARRASDAHRAARAAEAAAAEDFDPVRIRPFVEIGDGPADDPDGITPAPGSSSDPGGPSEPEAAEGGEHGAVPHLDELAPLPSDAGSRTPPRRRKVLLVTGLGTAAAVLLTGCLVGGLHWYDSPARDDSSSGGVRAGLPDAQPTGNAPSSPDASPSAPSESPSPSASPDTTPTSGPPTPTGGTTPTATTSGTPTASPTSSPPKDENPVLRPGDRGPEVTELQLRLRQVGFYGGDADGTYDTDVENAVRGYQLTRLVADEPGVYGAATRASLESETTEP